MAPIYSQSVGCFGDVAAWSFCQDKIMTTAGEGGMVITSRPELWDAMWSFEDHGNHEAVSVMNICPASAGCTSALVLTFALLNCRAPSPYPATAPA